MGVVDVVGVAQLREKWPVGRNGRFQVSPSPRSLFCGRREETVSAVESDLVLESWNAQTSLVVTGQQASLIVKNSLPELRCVGSVAYQICK